MAVFLVLLEGFLAGIPPRGPSEMVIRSQPAIEYSPALIPQNEVVVNIIPSNVSVEHVLTKIPNQCHFTMESTCPLDGGHFPDIVMPVSRLAHPVVGWRVSHHLNTGPFNNAVRE